MKSEELTARQRQIMDFIVDQTNRLGYPPSVREIGAAVGLSSSSTVHSHLRTLEKRGFIRRDPTKPRALEIFFSDKKQTAGDANITLPLVGRIAAGSPILAEENIEDYIAVPADLVRDKSFMLTVKGDSMIEAGIFDGDRVVIRRQNTADNGDIVAALIEDEATLKRFYKEKSQIRLQPENSAMKPILTRDVTILGKVTGLIRRIN